MNLQRAFLSDPERCTPDVLRDLIEDWRVGVHLIEHDKLLEAALRKAANFISDEDVIRNLFNHKAIYWFADKSRKHPTVKKLIEEQTNVMEEMDERQKRAVDDVISKMDAQVI